MERKDLDSSEEKWIAKYRDAALRNPPIERSGFLSLQRIFSFVRSFGRQSADFKVAQEAHMSDGPPSSALQSPDAVIGKVNESEDLKGIAITRKVQEAGRVQPASAKTARNPRRRA